MYISLINNTEFRLMATSQLNNFEEQIFSNSDFDSSEMQTINSFVDFQKAVMCQYFEIENQLEVSIDINYSTASENCYYIYNELSTGDKTILDDFISLINSKISA
jgi:hypothetical protein